VKYSISALLLMVVAGIAQADVTVPIKPMPVKFELVSSGHFIVKVKLNGKGPFNLIFDTGAPATLISPRIAKEANLVSKAKDRPLIPLFGMMGQVKIADFQVGDVKASDVQAQIMDHPTVQLFSKEYEKQHGPIEGIVGFPFFARYKMTVDYSTKQMTFAPSGYKADDVMQALMNSVMETMNQGSNPAPKVAAPTAIWGLAVNKKKDDEQAGVDVQEVLANTAAAQSGIKTGDRILTIDGRWTDSIADTYIAVAHVKAGSPVEVVLIREGKEIKLKVTPRIGL
jgi:membrane-associated protease RseP (regulator of RpoE activity)